MVTFGWVNTTRCGERVFVRLEKTKKMRKIIDFMIATIGCISDNNYICAGVLIYLLIRLKIEFDGEAINP